MELYASTVIWEGDGKLTVYDKTQGVQNVQRYLCGVFGMKPDDVRVMSPFMGGGFGSGLRPQFQVVLAVLAARALQRSVRVVLTRQQMYALGYRPAMIQRVALGANAGGTLDAITHEAIAVTSQYEDFSRQETGWSGLLYKCANAKYAHKLARLDLPTSCDMRAPGAATGVYALECAMDELAVALKLDPLELAAALLFGPRPERGPAVHAARSCANATARAPRRSAGSKRNPEPRSMRDGSELVGWGMATGVWEALQVPIAVRIVLTANGHAEVACATSDIGTGTYTIMAQVAADMLGPAARQHQHQARRLDAAAIAGRRRIVDRGLGGEWDRDDGRRDPRRAAAPGQADAEFAARRRRARRRRARRRQAGEQARRLARGVDRRRDAARRRGPHRAGEDHQPRRRSRARAHNTHSAIFAEVKVDEQLGVIRVTRVVSAVAAGRILNTKTARSQILGGVVWGIGMALHEETLIDHRFGRIMNANIAEYHVPVNADVHDIEVIFVDEPDDSNPLGIKGVGEIGIVGVAAAIANAVYHATGKRVRDLPITLDKLIA